MKYFTIILALLIPNFAFSEDIGIRFGKLLVVERIGQDGYRFEFLEEADRVPLLTLREGGVYGVEYQAPENYEYTVQVRAIVPSGVTDTGGDLESTKRTPKNTVMVFKPRSIVGTSVEPFLFSKGDPAGEYTLEITVNGKLVKQIRYQAYVPTAH
jgi:hypothetical protein